VNWFERKKRFKKIHVKKLPRVKYAGTFFLLLRNGGRDIMGVRQLPKLKLRGKENLQK